MSAAKGRQHTLRGLFMSIEYLCLNASYALSTWVGYALFFYMPHEISWRGPYTIQACLAIILVTWTFFLPETLRWLIKNRFQREGMITLADLHARGDIFDPIVAESYANIQAAIVLESHIGEAT
jgi:MFS family permease